VRRFNYPDNSFVRDIGDLPRLGIKTFFASDVCSAYRSRQYLASGGFPSPCNTSEDMLMAAKFIRNGYKVAYEAQASVIHSHNLSFKQQFQRNKEIGFFLEQHKDDLMGASEYGEGKRLVLSVANQLLAQGNVGGLVGFFSDCVARILGNRLGRAKYSMNRCCVDSNN
jgi:rhamnosyltransferase